MTKNKKILVAALGLTGLCGLVLLVLLAINLPLSKKKSTEPTPIVIATERLMDNLLKQSPTRVKNPGIQKIPFQSVVMITALYMDNGSLKKGWTGSGSFISSAGLILTNAHVVLSDLDNKVDMLTIAPTLRDDQKPQPTYIAKVVQADSNLDLAILKIVSDLNGNPVNLKELNFPPVAMGDSDKLSLGDRLTILGYPGIGGDTITLTGGEVAGFTGESGYGNRAFIKTSATIAGGNSGGLAVNEAGEMVGIPTQLGSGSDAGIVDCRLLADTNGDGVIDEDDTCIPTGGFINSLRPINLAVPMIDAALRGEENIVADTNPQQSQSPENNGVLYSNDFSNPTSGWTIDADSDGSVGFTDGMYYIQVNNPRKVITGTSGYEASDVVLDVSAQIAQSTGDGDFGLICRCQTDGSYYAFEVRENGYASIWKSNSGSVTPLVDWQYFQELEGTTNKRLSAVCVGNQLGLFLEGKKLMSTSDTDFQSGDNGLLAGTLNAGGLVVVFDDFQIRTPK